MEQGESRRVGGKGGGTRGLRDVAETTMSGWFATEARKNTCFFFNDSATNEIYALSLHDALPIFTYRNFAEYAEYVEYVEYAEHRGASRSASGQVGFQQRLRRIRGIRRLRGIRGASRSVAERRGAARSAAEHSVKMRTH